MAGAFTHFIICDVAKRKRASLGVELWRFLNKYSEFLFLGAVSPDLPYLSFKTGNINWADVMHYEKTNSIVISAFNTLKGKWSSITPADETKLAWLMGYVSHMVADATIHPIVQAIVGDYKDHKDDHRICEMTQDSMVFNEYKKNDITYAEFSSILKFCKESPSFDELTDFWNTQILTNYSDKKETPETSLWFTTYTKAVDAAEGGSAAALFRHIGSAKDYFYKPKADILSNYPEHLTKYFDEVRLPNGTTGSFRKDGFETTVQNVINAWTFLYSGLIADITVTDYVKNWNLDTGVNMDSSNKEVTFWV